jgi:biotin carboxyl carrier protein
MSQKIIAPLSGKVVRINFETNSSVAEDDEVLVIEAMKMETSVYAPCSGIMTKMSVNVGEEVEEDDLLAVIENA